MGRKKKKNIYMSRPPPPPDGFPPPPVGEGGVFLAVKLIVAAGMVSWPTYIYMYRIYNVNQI